METYFRYTPDDYQRIWAIALTSPVEDVIEEVRRIHQKDPSTLTNGGTPESVGRSIWESAEEHLRPPTLEEIDEVAETTKGWEYLSCPKGKISGTLRKLIENYRKTYPLYQPLSSEEIDALKRGGLNPTSRCPQCDNTKLKKRIWVCLESPDLPETKKSDEFLRAVKPHDFFAMQPIAVNWDAVRRYCPVCDWVEPNLLKKA